MEKIAKRKIMLIGTGMVGMSFAYTMLNERGIDELVDRKSTRLNSSH